MSQLTLILEALAPVALIMAAGCFAERIGWINQGSEQTIMRLLVNLLLPALILSKIVRNEMLRDPVVLVQSLLTGALAVGGGMLLALAASRLFRVQTANQGTFAVAVGLYNYGYMSIPLIEIFFDRETLGVLFAVFATIDLTVWTLGVFLVRGKSPGGNPLRNLTPPPLAVLLGLTLLYLGIGERIPDFALSFLDQLGRCAMPIGLLMTGISISELLRHSGKDLFSDHRTVMLGASLRLLLIPAIMTAASCLLPLSEPLRNVLIVHAAMPSAVFTVVLAKHFNGHPLTALRLIISTTAACIITTPAWLLIGLRLKEVLP